MIPSTELDKIFQKLNIVPQITIIDISYQYDELPNTNNQCLYVTSDFKYYQTDHPYIVYFPCWYFVSTVDTGNIGNRLLTSHDIQSHRPWILSCFNHTPRLERAKNYIALSKQPWFDQCKISFGPKATNNTHIIDAAMSGIKLYLDAEEFNFIQSVVPRYIDIDNEPSTDIGVISNTSLAHGQCYIDLVVESTLHHAFISEKSWKPLLSGQLFLILGPIGIVAHLRQLGIDTFSDIIDHSYDQESNLDKKISMIINELNQLINQGLDAIWDNTYERRKANLELVLSEKFKLMLVSDVLDRVR